MGLFSRKSLAAGTAIAWALGAPTAVYAQATYSFNMPAQDLGRALRTVARRTGANVVFDPASVRGKTAPALNGSFSAAQAIRQLLAGSGLDARQTSGGSWVVAPSGEAQAGSAAADSGSADQTGTPEILVVGTRSQNVDIRRSEDGPQPYVVFDSREIEQSQVTNLEDFFRTRLPMNTQQGAANQDPGIQNTNVSSINLRGLGSDQTLILVDGRRAPRVSLQTAGDDFTQADINGIPLSAIERIEVLPSTAGGIYGGGAVGGVINIIRKRNYNGVDVRLGYNGTFRGGGEEVRAEVSGGFSPDGGTTQISFSASHSRSRPLYAEDNDLWRHSRALYLADTDRLLPSSIAPFTAYTPNIASSFVGGVRPNLVLDNGTPLGSYRTFVPVGYAGSLSDGGAALVANAGHFNLDLADSPAGRFAQLRNNPRVWSANVNVRRSFGRNVDVFVDFTYSDNLGRSQSARSVAVSLPANSPANPFRQAIDVVLPLPGQSSPVVSRSQVFGGSGGLIARLGGNWVATAEYDYSRARSSLRSNAELRSGSAGFTTALRSGTIDFLRDANQFPIDYSPYIFPVADRSGPFNTTEQIASARASGPIADVWGGPLTLTALVERRLEAAQQSRTDRVSNGVASVTPARSQAVTSGYAELNLPLVSDRNAMPFLHALEIQASLRYDRYHTRTAQLIAYRPPAVPILDFDYATSNLETTNYTLAARWAPARDLSFRASYSTGFLPPALSDLVSFEVFREEAFGRDPRRGGQQVNLFVPADEVVGGNPDLEPERSRSFSLGAIFTPRFLPGFRISVDYSRISKRGEISALNDQGILDNEDVLPGRVERGPNLPGDPPGWAGPVTLINATSLNISRSRVEALDFQADYAFDTAHFGSFRFYAIATRLLTFRRQLAPATAALDSIGVSGGPLGWRGNAGIDWSIGNWRIAWNTQYYSGYNTRAPSGIATVFDEQIPRQIYNDLSVTYRFGPGNSPFMSDLDISLGIQNIFDTRPPILRSPSIISYSTYGDPRLRRFSLSIRKHF